MAWTTISNAAVAVGGIPSSATMTALRDNFAGMAAAEAGAPVVFAGWHPYDKVTIGDSADGKFYDFSVNGAQASVVTPDFEDGYEYRIIGRNLSHSSGSNQSLIIEFADSGGNYDDDISTTAASGTANFAFDAQLSLPRVGAAEIPVLFFGTGISTVAQHLEMGGSAILRARIKFSAGNIDAGRLWLLRCREYVSSP